MISGIFVISGMLLAASLALHVINRIIEAKDIGTMADEIVSLRGDRDKLKERLDDWEDSVRRVMDEPCNEDEKHCTCVPALRAELEAVNERAKDWEFAHDHTRATWKGKAEQLATELESAKADLQQHSDWVDDEEWMEGRIRELRNH